MIKVHLGVLTRAFVHPNFAMALAYMMRTATNYNLSARDVIGDGCALNRNVTVHDAKLANADYLLFLDTDMEFPIETLDVLVSEAVANKRDVIGCYYVGRQPHHACLVQPCVDTTRFEPIMEVARLPTGVMLIDMRVFSKLKKPYFRDSFREETPDVEPCLYSEDYMFCDAARAAGFKVWMHTELSQKVVHYGVAGFRWCGDGIELLAPTGGVYMKYVPVEGAVLRSGKPVEQSAAA